jgi:hypothetical protein
VAQNFMWRSLRDARKDASLHSTKRHITSLADVQRKVRLRRSQIRMQQFELDLAGSADESPVRELERAGRHYGPFARKPSP